MAPVAHRIALAGLVLAITVPGAGRFGAQETETGVDEARVIIPRAKVLRAPSDESGSGESDTTRGLQLNGTQDQTAGLQDQETIAPAESVLEIRPLEPLEGSTSGGGVVPAEDRVVLQTDPTATPSDGQEDVPAVRIITPTPQESEATPLQPADESDGDDAETAATSEEDDRPRWRRERTKRFKLAPKADETQDDSKPFAVPIETAVTGIKEGARLRQLDKMTGQTVTFDLANGESRKIDRLLVSLEACRSPENNATRGAMAFLEIRDTRNVDGEPNFTGWMFAESPALSALDHPRYDLWLINCITSDADVSVVNE